MYGFLKKAEGTGTGTYGEKVILAALFTLRPNEFFVADTRGSIELNGLHFAVEAGFSFRGIGRSGKSRLFCFVNRVPSPKSITGILSKIVSEFPWEDYTLEHSNGSLPVGEHGIFVHVTYPLSKVKITEVIVSAIEKEIDSALIKCAERLREFVEKRYAKTQTLFDQDYPKHVLDPYPFDLYLDGLLNGEDEEFDETEKIAFQDVVELERQMYRGSYTFLAGPVVIQIGGHDPVNLKYATQLLPLPDFVEQDSVRIINCEASGILFVARLTHEQVETLLASSAWRALNLVIVSGVGLPRMPFRRFLHRIQQETGLPVYALTDNDTWGYFALSILNRGLLAPHKQCEFLAVPGVRWLGLHSGEFKDYPKALRRWKSHWKLRLDCMRKYPCFQNPAWAREFDAFETQHSKMKLNSLFEAVGPDVFVNEYIAKKIDRSEWIVV